MGKIDYKDYRVADSLTRSGPIRTGFRSSLPRHLPVEPLCFPRLRTLTADGLITRCWACICAHHGAAHLLFTTNDKPIERVVILLKQGPTQRREV